MRGEEQIITINDDFPDQRQWITLEEAATRYDLLDAYIQGKMDGRRGWTKVAGHVRLYSVSWLEKVKAWSHP